MFTHISKGGSIWVWCIAIFHGHNLRFSSFATSFSASTGDDLVSIIERYLFQWKILCAFIWMKFTNMFSCICNLGWQSIFTADSSLFERSTPLIICCVYQGCQQAFPEYADTDCFYMLRAVDAGENISRFYIIARCILHHPCIAKSSFEMAYFWQYMKNIIGNIGPNVHK